MKIYNDNDYANLLYSFRANLLYSFTPLLLTPLLLNHYLKTKKHESNSIQELP